ncbi:cytochrome P450 [Streptomyces iconiensis]|uniref:Cytochrome P450 n=1 Tax=Streptomyces iconiensis TaxID=1384038 RepID=A0ABT6ZZI7_9ACTN|nr:cytochrome P450 [Streptomyces iconiensis]MDJ1134495.1 cytochrome P450 [Streptomyces iconiensis]
MTTRPEADANSAHPFPDFPHPRSSACPFGVSPEMRALRDRGAVSRVRSWGGSTPWVVTSHAEQKALLADPRLSADFSHPGFPSPVDPEKAGRGRRDMSFVGMDDPEHARLRRMVSGVFTVKRMRALRPVVQKMTDDFIDSMLAGPRPADLVQALALPLPSLVISRLLGVPYEDHEFFQTNSRTIVSSVATAEARSTAHTNLAGYLDDLVARKTTDPGDDLLTQLGERVGAGELTRQQAASMGVLLLLGGHETTANMITLGTLLLLEHPGQLAAIREADDPKVIADAVEELLRYPSIVHLGRRRTALEDIDIAGETIRAGEGVILLSELANRDPSAFPDPDTLDLTRDARSHLAFGAGTHHCVGQPLARMELQILYPTLFCRVPTLRTAVETDQVPFKHDAVIYGVHELPVTW